MRGDRLLAVAVVALGFLMAIGCSRASLGEDGLYCKSDARESAVYDYADGTDLVRTDPVDAVATMFAGDMPDGSTLEVAGGTDVTLLDEAGQPIAHIKTMSFDDGLVVDTYSACPGVLPDGS